MDKFCGLDYLKIDVANQYGHDKLPWMQRIDWTNQMMHHGIDKVLEAADQADAPFLYIKAVHALNDAIKGKWIGHPMGLDATASGLQLMAVAIGCKETAERVNLIDTGNREDVYGYIGKIVGEPKKVVKKPIMTTFYGSRQQPIDVFGEGTPRLARFYKALYDHLPGAMELMTDMQSCWNRLVKAHRWTMPDGHHVVAKIMTPVDKRLELDELNHSKFTFRSYVNTTAERGVSLAANIIHSIDGYVVREMLRRMHRQGKDLGTIHDSFWAHPNDMNDVRRHYLDILIELADSNIMEDILRQVTQNPRLSFTKRSTDLSRHMADANYALS